RSAPTLRVGPLSHPNFPFVLVDRALLHYGAVSRTSHAKSASSDGVMTIDGDGGSFTSSLPEEQRRRLHRAFERTRKTGRADESLEPELTRVLDVFDERRSHVSSAHQGASR
ncbi:MAG: hypothetical protein HC923_01555, partial [Myxococcales bacterium]|nr:hypothetical protein [Myxococcales bacterium]